MTLDVVENISDNSNEGGDASLKIEVKNVRYNL